MECLMEMEQNHSTDQNNHLELQQNEAVSGNKVSPDQLRVLSAQIAAYKMLARNEPVPRALLSQVTFKNIFLIFVVVGQ